MIGATNLKNGTTFEKDGKIYMVKKYTHQKIGKGGANVILQVRNLENGNIEEKTFNSNSKVEEISTIKRPLQYLYSDGDMASFMDEKTFEQIEIPIKVVEDELSFIKEGEVANILFLSGKAGEEDRPLSIDIAPKVTLVVKETGPGAKGNSATNVFKPAVLENDLSVKVPIFMKVGDRVRIDTRTGEYVERVS